MTGRLQDRVAVVTGAARGMGRAIALRFAQEGTPLALCDMNKTAVEETAHEAEAFGVKVIATQTDVSARAAVEAMITGCVATLGVPDILVNNAGIFFNEAFEALTDEQWSRMINTNLTSVFLVTQTVIRHWLPLSPRPLAVVCQASISASVAFTNSAHYCAAKAGVLAVTKCVALEYGHLGLRANAMAPGLIDTPMLAKGMAEPETMAYWHKRLALKRLGTPEDVADVALFLASDDSRYVTGDMIYVDGGWMLE